MQSLKFCLVSQSEVKLSDIVLDNSSFKNIFPQNIQKIVLGFRNLPDCCFNFPFTKLYFQTKEQTNTQNGMESFYKLPKLSIMNFVLMSNFLKNNFIY